MAGDEPTTDELLRAFGRWLKRERELRDLSREELAASTRLGPAVIEALESGDAARMPPRAYVVGYLRSYGAAVGLDADELVLRWQEAAGAEPEEDDRPRRRQWLTLLGAAVLVGTVAALLVGALVKALG
jgi:cytoskeletal protein RodZ